LSSKDRGDLKQEPGQISLELIHLYVVSAAKNMLLLMTKTFLQWHISLA
jgi:hypothetical protein